MLPSRSRSVGLLRRAVVFSLAITALGLGVAGCAKKPTMHVNHAEVSGIKVALGLPPSVGVAMIIALDVNNPNSYDVAIRAVRGSVYLANKWQLPVDFQPGGEGVWLRSNGITQVRVPTIVPAGVAAAVLAESFMQPQIPYRFQGRADVTATRTFALEKDDYSVDESGFVSRQQIEAATRSF